jgi:putative PIN family toxin of toxin-antitoxin system
MKVVLDTNLLVSALINSRGTPAKILEAWKNGEIILIFSPAILKEIGQVLNYHQIGKLHGMSTKEINDFLEELKEYCLIVQGTIKVKVIKEDPSDDKFIACALEGEADFIVSGDKHLQRIRESHGIPIIKPQDFLAMLN